MAPRNLFRVRTTESIDDAAFLQLFGTAALDIFEPQEIWSRMQIIRSSRGGGKTSVLRIFSPKTLNAVKNQSGNLKPLADKLVELGALSETRAVNVLGVRLSLVGSYQLLENIGLDPPRSQMLFFALLSSKIVMSALRSVCELKNADLQDGLRRIRVGRPDDSVRGCVPVPCDGTKLYEWADGIEGRVYSIMEGQDGSYEGMSGYETLSVVRLIQHPNLSYDGECAAPKTLLMLDDVDKITPAQRKDLSRALTDLRVPLVWMAERLEALKPKDLLAVNGTEGREWRAPILEKFWADSTRRAKFARLLEAIADSRAGMQPGTFRNAFGDIDQSDLRCEKAAAQEHERLHAKFGDKSAYRDWFTMTQGGDYTHADRAVRWKLLDIVIERMERRKQTTILPDAAWAQDEFQPPADTKHVADFHIRRNHGIPYYHGFDNLTKLASYNILQFLGLASDFFDEMTNARTAGQPDEISPERQERILEKAAELHWDDACRAVQDPGFENFIESVVRLCERETGLPNAPYNGVTGIAISERNMKRLQNVPYDGTRARDERLARILSHCFAHNILEPKVDSLQGAHGTKHLVMYLNRLLCVRYKLPLQYGGWRTRSLEELDEFTRDIVRPRKAAGTDPAQRHLEVGA